MLRWLRDARRVLCEDATLRRATRFVVGFVCVWGALSVGRTFVTETFYIASGSMARTLHVGDILAVNKAVYGTPVPHTGWRVPGWRDPAVGDIVVFRAEDGVATVKRVVGTPGDTLAMNGGVLVRNGRAVDEPYVLRDVTATGRVDAEPMQWQRRYLVRGARARTSYRPTLTDWGPLVVPEGRYFLLGDNRDHSYDSRFWGFVEREAILGEVSLLYYTFVPRPWIAVPVLFGGGEEDDGA